MTNDSKVSVVFEDFDTSVCSRFILTEYFYVPTSCDASGKVLVNSTFEKDHSEKPWTELQNKSVWICERGWLVEYGWIHSIDFIDQGRYTSGLETF